MNRSVAAIAALLLATAILWALTPTGLRHEPQAYDLPQDLDAWLEQQESAVAARFGLVPGTEKRITWFNGHERTPYSVIYIHGFSATRQETAPLAATIAARLGANLFETRLTGHGRKREALDAVRAEDWLEDAGEALAIASRLGEQIVIVSTSTGATLAAAMLGDPAMSVVDTIVMLSPNFEPRDSGAAWLTRPAGPWLARMLVGETRSWQPHNEQQERFWTTSYPTSAAVEMMRLVALANRRLPAEISQRLLVFYSRDDEVISPAAAIAVLDQTDAPLKSAIEISAPGDPSNHVLAGDVLSPATTHGIADATVEFILRPAP